ncbi:MAG: hypothetical protein GAK41_01641 [Burkholderia gladioli]|nr:MAG: hypothetical protein GAK41_01641 [Burkholderia gladioli]
MSRQPSDRDRKREPSAPVAPTASGGFAGLLRTRLAAGVTMLTSGGGGPSIDYSSPPGDPGLFGPDAVCWRVHADFTSMMAGGIAALLLQALHPLALAGVWDHSSFRTDILDRLRRTATFVAGTTFASRADALHLIERVKTIHDGVTGTAPDDRPYPRAADLGGCGRGVELPGRLPALREPGAERRGTGSLLRRNVPHRRDARRGRRAVLARGNRRAYLDRMRGELVASERTHEVIRVLREAPMPRAVMRPASALQFHAGVDLLPDWAQRQIGLAALAPMRRIVARPGVRLMGSVMRWALVNGASKRSRRRAAAAPSAAPATPPATRSAPPPGQTEPHPAPTVDE